MNTKTRNLLLLLLSATLSLALVVGCDDDDGEDPGDMVTDVSDTGGGDTDETDTNTEDDTDETDTNTEDDTTETDTADDATDTADDATDTADDATDTEDDATDTEDDATDTEDDMMMAVGSVTADDQTLDDLSTLVPVTEVVSVGDGWIVIHEDDGSGGPGPVIGHAAVVDGTNADVVVALERPAADGETLHAMLHLEDPVDGAYTFDGANGEDAPATDDAGNVIMDPFVVTVPTDLAAVRVMVSASSAEDYTFDGAEPALHEAAVFPNGVGQDVELQLTPGWRYEVVNAATGSHPFEFITELVADTVLLSESADGTLEADATINWVDDGSGTVQFTVSTTFQAAADAYRCSIHTAAMRGTISYAAP